MLNGLRRAAQSLAFPNDCVALLAALLLANSLRLHVRHWAADVVFGVVAALLGLSLFREGGVFGATPPGRHPQSIGTSPPKLLLTPLCFAALLALYGAGLIFDFSGQGLRNFTGLFCIAVVFLFCYQNGSALAQSRSAILMFLLAAFAFLPLYWTSSTAHPVFLSVYLGYALLTVGILLAARCRSRKAQHLWVHATFLAATAAAVAFGSRAMALAMLLALPFYWGAYRLLHSRGRALALAGGALALMCLVSALLSSSRIQEVLSNFNATGWSYTGEPLENARQMLFRASMSGILDAPWFGNGPAADVTKLPPSKHSPFDSQEPYCLHWANPGLLNDCRALLQARYALTGANRALLWSWDFDQPIASWQGVELGGSPPRIVGLNLAGRNLVGQIPPVLGELQQLSVLRLHRNYLNGAIPPELGKLRNLTILTLSKNTLTGAIPKELGNLANLEHLLLHRNRLSGDIPEALTALNKLRLLTLHGNDFAGPPPPKLRIAHRDAHRDLLCLPPLSTHPELLQDCTVLLEARDALAGSGVWLNWRHSVPIHQWQGVVLGDQPLRVIALHLTKVGLRGQIPAQIAKLDALNQLYLSNNRLTGEVPAELGFLPKLQMLRLAGNEFSAPVPDELRSTLDHDLDTDLYCAPGPRIGPALLEDCTALLTMRGTLAGNGRLNWRRSSPIREWQGVKVGDDLARVVQISLPDAGLSGQIPPELGRLDQLVELHLQNNQLTGPVPAELGRLGQLVKLHLQNNQLIGPVPAELGDLQNLESLHLANNELNGAPPLRIGTLPNVQELDLHGNNFADGVPTALWEVADRNLHRNWFCPLPAQANSGLDADCNLLLAVRDTLAGRTTLNWRRDRPVGIWQGVEVGGSPARVQALELRDSGLSGRIPPELGSLAKLRRLELQSNALTGTIPPQLGNLKNLQDLRLQWNRLTGAVPPELAALDLKVLALHFNYLIGPIPPNPRHLSLGRHRGGSLTARDTMAAAPLEVSQADQGDADLGMLCQELAEDHPGLQADCDLLLAARDRLAGSVRLNWAPTTPVRFWQGVTLGGTPLRVIALDLSRWGIDGVIPPQLGGLQRLISLHLHRNALVGPIPPALGQLAHLRELLLSGNALTGPIPRQLGHLSQLTALHLRRNRLHGTIPAELGKLTSLRTLALDGNELTGPMPEELANLLDLEELLVGGNKLSGGVPAAVQALPKLSVLWPEASLASLALEGRPSPLATAGSTGHPPPATSTFVPPQVDESETSAEAELFCSPNIEVGLHQDCSRLLAMRDKLAGDAELNWRSSVPINAWRGVRIGGRPMRVTALELPHANLNGHLPKALRHLDQLVSLRLEGNRLGGTLLRNFGGLQHLQTLTLEGNALTGTVPSSLLNLKNLRELKLSDNHLVGDAATTLSGLHYPLYRRLGGNDFTGCLPPSLRFVPDRRFELDLRCDPSPWSKPKWLEDAAVLMSARDTLAGDIELNWRYDRPLGSWQGVSVGSHPVRVVALDLSRTELNGSIPAQLGALDALVDLRLSGNRLTGAIPPELSRLTDLRTLRLDGNALTGPIPKKLASLRLLEDLRVGGNRLTGCRENIHYAFYRFLSPEQFPVCLPNWRRDMGKVGGYIHQVNDLLNPASNLHLAESSHNLFLHIGLQSGLLGLGVVGLLCLSLILNLRRRGAVEATPVQCFAAASAFTAIFYSAFEIFLLQHFLSAAIFAWAAIGVGTGLARTTATDGDTQCAS